MFFLIWNNALASFLIRTYVQPLYVETHVWVERTSKSSERIGYFFGEDVYDKI